MTCRRRALVAALLAAPLVLRAQPIEVIDLRHRSAEELLPLLRPLLDPGSALTGRGYQLFLRTTPANRRQLLELLRTLDAPRRQLEISVRQDAADESSRERRSADGSLTIGSRGIDGAISARADNSRRWSTQAAIQRIRVLEGTSAFIAFGAAVPMTFRQWVVTPQGLTELRGTAYFEALTGFHARVQLAGDEVTLELSPEQSMIGADRIERTRLSTTVRGRLGEWLEVGGVDAQPVAQGIATLAADRSADRHRRGVWLKVDPVSPN